MLNKLNQFAKFLFNPENRSKQLFITSAAGWVLASLAQTAGLIANKNIDKKEKKFLIPQEICDGIFNIGSYAAITLSLIKGAEKLFEVTSKEGVLKKPKILIKTVEDAFKNKTIDVSQYKDAYKNMGKNAGVAATITGTIISACILTPIARNFVSGMIQKYYKSSKDIPVKQFKPNSQPMYTETNMGADTPISMNSFLKSVKPYNTAYNGNLRI